MFGVLKIIHYIVGVINKQNVSLKIVKNYDNNGQNDFRKLLYGIESCKPVCIPQHSQLGV